jgi:NADPH-dependent 2,4-dienoyl-CoA reductase/sulfur reductase-like enzyme
MPRRIVVVGGLAAGPAAASKAKRVQPSSEVILIEKSRFISYGICELPFFISNVINNYNDLIVYTKEKFQSEKNVDVRLSQELKEIDYKNKELLVFDSELNQIYRLAYDKLILALGSTPLKMNNLPNASNIFNFKFLDDGIKLKSFLSYNDNQTAVIFGTGFIGLELAESLCKLGLKVILFDINDLPMNYFEDLTRKHLLKLLLENNIEYVKYSAINSCNIKEDRIDSIEIDGKFYKTDVIITAIGIEPNTALTKGTGIKLGTRNGILVNQKMQTNLTDIYACGDCCELQNKISLKTGFYPFANLAQKTGWIAGENAAGQMKSYKGVIPAYTTKLFGYEFAHVGITFQQAIATGLKAAMVSTRGLTKPAIMADAKTITAILIYIKDTKVIIGAELFGHEDCSLRANILAAAIEKKMSLDELSDLNMVYHPLVTPLRDPIQYCAGLGLR